MDTLDVVLPLLVGGIIYLAWRGTNLRMFGWANEIGFGHAVALLRAELGGWRFVVPGYVIYSLPDALWTYSFARFHYVLYARGNCAAWLAVAPAVALGSEVGQAVGIVPGTFDWRDLLLCSAAALLALRPRRTR